MIKIILFCSMAFRIQTKIHKLKAKMERLKTLQAEVSRELNDVSCPPLLVCTYNVIGIIYCGLFYLLPFEESSEYIGIIILG